MISEILDGTFDPNAPRVKMIIQGKQPLKKQRAQASDPTQAAIAPWPEILPGESVREDVENAQQEQTVPLPDPVQHAQGTAQDVEPEAAPAQEISDSESSSSSDSSDLQSVDLPDSRFDDDQIEAIGLEPKQQNVHVSGFDTFQHVRTGTIHYRDPSFASKLLCNRVYTAVYAKITGSMKYQWPVCNLCLLRTSSK